MRAVGQWPWGAGVGRGRHISYQDIHESRGAVAVGQPVTSHIKIFMRDVRAGPFCKRNPPPQSISNAHSSKGLPLKAKARYCPRR